METTENVIDFDQIRTDYKPMRIPYKGETYTIDTFDGALMQRMNEAAIKSANDTTKTAHDANAAQIHAATGIPLELLAKEDYRNIKKMMRAITDAVLKAGEDVATKAP